MNGLVERFGREEFEGVLGVADAVERKRRLVLRKALSIGVFGILLLEVAAVLQDQLGNVARRLGRVDSAAEAISNELGQIAGMVEVGMRQDDGVDARWRNRKCCPVEFAQVLQALEQAAIDQDALVAIGEEMFRAGDGSRTAKRS